MALLGIFSKKKEKNINLLSEEGAKRAVGKKDFWLLLSIPLIVLILLALVFVALFILGLTESAKNKRLIKNINQKTVEWQKYSVLAETLKRVNTDMKSFQQGQSVNSALLDSIVSVQSLVPDRLTLRKLSTKESGDVQIDGVSSDAKIVYQFSEMLKQNEQDFSDVKLNSIGFSSAEGNFTFSISGKFKGVK